MRFKLGDKALLLREKGEVVVVRYINDQFLVVEDEHGFEHTMKETDLSEIYVEKEAIKVNRRPLKVIGENQLNKSIKDKVFKGNNCWEIDLHTHNLMDDESGLTKHELLLYQLREFKTFYRKARNNHIRKIIVIHGVGSGKLKSEVRHYLTGQSGLEFYDASYGDYGKGATEIRLFYK